MSYDISCSKYISFTLYFKYVQTKTLTNSLGRLTTEMRSKRCWPRRKTSKTQAKKTSTLLNSNTIKIDCQCFTFLCLILFISLVLTDMYRKQNRINNYICLYFSLISLNCTFSHEHTRGISIVYAIMSAFRQYGKGLIHIRCYLLQ